MSDALEMFTLGDVVYSAVLSDDGVYRYRLSRCWSDGPRMLFVMLNPSTADAEQDDPTIRRCIRFAQREGCGALDVVNLFAYRATDPSELERCPVDVFGPENYRTIRTAAAEADTVVAAWGAHKCATPGTVEAVRHAVIKPMRCLGTTKDGSPRHPLYVHSMQPLLLWPRPVGCTRPGCGRPKSEHEFGEFCP